MASKLVQLFTLNLTVLLVFSTLTPLVTNTIYFSLHFETPQTPQLCMTSDGTFITNSY